MKDQAKSKNENRSAPEQLQTLKSDHPQEQLVIEKFRKEGFTSLTTIQRKALPVIARKVNCLLVAPTGSGKTEAAVLPVFTMLAQEKSPGKIIRAMYITPLRALNNDVLRRVVRYAQSEGLMVEIRHGDTTVLARKKIVEDPPDVLITTPESLAVILTSEKMLAALKGLQWVIVDEVHELVSNERGAHLSLSLERLQAVLPERDGRAGVGLAFPATAHLLAMLDPLRYEHSSGSLRRAAARTRSPVSSSDSKEATTQGHRSAGTPISPRPRTNPAQATAWNRFRLSSDRR